MIPSDMPSHVKYLLHTLDSACEITLRLADLCIYGFVSKL